MLQHWITEKVQEAADSASQMLIVLEETRTLLISDTTDLTTGFRKLPVKASDAFTHLKIAGEPVQVYNASNEPYTSEDDFSVYTDLVHQEHYKIIEVLGGVVEQEAIRAARRLFSRLEVCDFRAPVAVQFDVARPGLPQEVTRRLQEQLAIETDIATRDEHGMQMSRNNTLPFRLPLSLAYRVLGRYANSSLQDSCREILENQVLSRKPGPLPEVSAGPDFVTVSVFGHDGLFEEVSQVVQAMQVGYQATCLGLLLEGLTEIEGVMDAPVAPSTPEAAEPVTDEPAQAQEEEEQVFGSLATKIRGIGIRPLGLEERRSSDEILRISSQVTKGWKTLTQLKTDRLNSFIRSYPFLSDGDIITSLRRAQFSEAQIQVAACFLGTISYKETALELKMDPAHVRKTCLSVVETLGERQARPDRSPTMTLVRLSFDLALDNLGVLVMPNRSDRGVSNSIKAWFSEQGKAGGTTPECAQALGFSTSLVSAVAVQLVESKFLKETGRKRGTPKSKVRESV